VTKSETDVAVIEPMLPRQYRVRRIRKETHDSFTIELTPVDGASEFTFAAGQFNMLYVFGVGEVPISISGDPTDTRTLVHTTRAVGAVTRTMRNLKPGDVIGVRGPFGTHWPVEEAVGSDVLIIGGGIAFAPLRPIVYQILSQREKYGKVVLLYGARSPADILYRRELEKWRARLDLEVEVTVDRASPAWRGNVGVVTTLIPKAPCDPLSTVAMVCGPEVMMRYVVQGLRQCGLEPEDIYISMERNMKCGIGLCGHCQLGPMFICKDGPIFRYDKIEQWFLKREI
jgi:NAD(P)H-flavin reductase